MDHPSEPVISAWKALVRSSENALAAIEAELKAAGLPPLDWYDMLFEIEKAGDGGIRPMDLESRLLMRQYSTSRLIARMVEKGYLSRETVAEDRRGFAVRITEGGRRVRRAMWPVYAAGISRAMGDLSEGELATITTLLARVGRPPPGDRPKT